MRWDPKRTCCEPDKPLPNLNDCLVETLEPNKVSPTTLIDTLPTDSPQTDKEPPSPDKAAHADIRFTARHAQERQTRT